LKNNEFLEWARVHKIYYVGTLKKEFERLKNKYQTIIYVIDVRGLKNIRQLKIPHISIFINAESKEKLISRIKKRAGGMPPRLLKLRLGSAIREIREAKKYDYQVINYENKLKETINQIVKIVESNIDTN